VDDAHPADTALATLGKIVVQQLGDLARPERVQIQLAGDGQGDWIGIGFTDMAAFLDRRKFKRQKTRPLQGGLLTHTPLTNKEQAIPDKSYDLATRTIFIILAARAMPASGFDLRLRAENSGGDGQRRVGPQAKLVQAGVDVLLNGLEARGLNHVGGQHEHSGIDLALSGTGTGGEHGETGKGGGANCFS